MIRRCWVIRVLAAAISQGPAIGEVLAVIAGVGEEGQELAGTGLA
jgi:hypothetical protein